MRTARTILTLAIWLTASLCFAQAEAIIVGPDTVNPGDLVILDGSESAADSREWILVGSDKQFLVFEDGRKLVFASGSPGSYTFVLAVAQSENNMATISVAKHVVTVVGPIPPQPVPPTPPGPGPGPTPPVPPVPDLSPTAKAVYDVVSKIERQPREAEAVAAELFSVVAKADDEGWEFGKVKLQMQSGILAALVTDEQRQRWNPFRDWFLAHVRQHATDRDSALRECHEIAKGVHAVNLTEQPGAVSDPSNESLKDTIRDLKGSLESLKREVGE